MKLDGPFRLVITGDTSTFLRASTGASGFDYLIDRLFRGEEVAERNFEHWGLTIEDDSGSLASE